MNSLEEVLQQVRMTADFAEHPVDSANSTNGYGDTPLHIAACWGNIGAIKLLIEAGADINKKGETGFTPLHCAAEQGHPNAVRYLLLVGATSVKNNDGLLPIELAEALNNIEVVNAIKHGI